jgi:hypothetical protein
MAHTFSIKHQQFVFAELPFLLSGYKALLAALPPSGEEQTQIYTMQPVTVTIRDLLSARSFCPHSTLTALLLIQGVALMNGGISLRDFTFCSSKPHSVIMGLTNDKVNYF